MFKSLITGTGNDGRAGSLLILILTHRYSLVTINQDTYAKFVYEVKECRMYYALPHIIVTLNIINLIFFLK